VVTTPLKKQKSMPKPMTSKENAEQTTKLQLDPKECIKQTICERGCPYITLQQSRTAITKLDAICNKDQKHQQNSRKQSESIA
jgi:ferredoxin